MQTSSQLSYTSKPGGPLRGSVQVPGDKSVSHRALLLGAIANGVTTIRGFLDSEDTHATRQVLQMLGITINDVKGALRVSGNGLHGFQRPSGPLYFGNSGTSVRLMTGLLAGQAFDTVLTGDESLSKRPMRRVAEPLRLMNADVETSGTGTLPITVHGGRQLHGITYDLPVASAQLKSALLLAGLCASGRTCVREPAVTRDHTERMLRHFGCELEVSRGQVCLNSQELSACDIDVPADISSAAFFMVAALITPGSDLVLRRTGINPTRDAVLEILTRMGADIELENRLELSGEPVADIRVRHSELTGITIPEALVPIAIDEFPALMVAAACAAGTTVLTGAAELRVKESDRIEAVAAGLRALGISVETYPDGMRVQGGRFEGGEVDSCTDHRIAMAFSVAGLAAAGPVTIHDCRNVNTSFPGFVDLMRSAGAGLVSSGDDN